MPRPQSAGASAGSSGPVRLLRSHQLSQSVPYAYAATTDEPGRLLLTAGACPLDAEGRTVAPGDVTAQAQQVMLNLRTTLAEAGADLTSVVKSTVYVATTDRADLDAAWSVVATAFGEHDAPSTLLGVAVLGWPDQLVEVEAVAVLPAGPRRGSTAMTPDARSGEPRSTSRRGAPQPPPPPAERRDVVERRPADDRAVP